MFPRLSRVMLVALLVATTGGHWLLLQSVAWITMAVHFAQSNPLPVALEKTFDGRHPCRLCKVVMEGKKAERKQETLQAKHNLELFFELKTISLDAPSLFEPSFAFALSRQDRSESPPTPPPRRV